MWELHFSGQKFYEEEFGVRFICVLPKFAIYFLEDSLFDASHFNSPNGNTKYFTFTSKPVRPLHVPRLVVNPTNHMLHRVPKMVKSFCISSCMLKSSKSMLTTNIRCFSRLVSLSTSRLRPMPLPPPMETHLWYMVPDEVKSSSLLNQYLEILSPSEKQSLLSLREDGLRKKATLARALVRTTLARYQTNSYIDPRSLQFKKNAHGKPEVDWQHAPDWGQPSLHFNISHTSSLIACGITTHSMIGIDIEEKARKLKNNVMSFARRFFCPHEVEYLANILDPEAQRLEFLKLWTLKEAYVKALGKGFSAAPFSTFRVHIRTSDTQGNTEFEIPEICIESTQSPDSKWKLGLVELANTHFASICIENSENKASPMALKVWKTVPFVEDVCMSDTASVATIAGSVKQLS